MFYCPERKQWVSSLRESSRRPSTPLCRSGGWPLHPPTPLVSVCVLCGSRSAEPVWVLPAMSCCHAPCAQQWKVKRTDCLYQWVLIRALLQQQRAVASSCISEMYSDSWLQKLPQSAFQRVLGFWSPWIDPVWRLTLPLAVESSPTSSERLPSQQHTSYESLVSQDPHPVNPNLDKQLVSTAAVEVQLPQSSSAVLFTGQSIPPMNLDEQSVLPCSIACSWQQPAVLDLHLRMQLWLGCSFDL